MRGGRLLRRKRSRKDFGCEARAARISVRCEADGCGAAVPDGGSAETCTGGGCGAGPVRFVSC